MVPDSTYELCLPILKDETLNEEEKTDKLEDLLKETPLPGRSLQETILAVLWRYRDATVQPAASPPKNVVVRRGSPAPWQVPRAATPLASPSLVGASPVSSHGFFPRGKQSTASPFSSPKPSPRLAFTSPIPHSPSLNTYEFSEPSLGPPDCGDYGSDTVDWLVNDEEHSRPTSSSATSAFESNLSASAAPWVQYQQSEMSPYDMLRSILGEAKTDEEIETALEANGYDLSATVMSLMSMPEVYEDPKLQGAAGQVTIGKVMATTPAISTGQKGAPGKSSVICKYWLSTGSCLRSDCRFSHEYRNHLCKYWIVGNCLAGDTCVFSHDPSALMANIGLNGQQSTEIGDAAQPSFHVQDYDSSPALSATAPSFSLGAHAHVGGRGYSFNSPGNQYANAAASPRSYGSRPGSRPSSRAATPSVPPVDDNEAFPALGPSGAKGTRKHHGKRGGHGHSTHSKENTPDMRMSPSPSPSLLRRGLVKTRPYVSSREQNPAATAIPPPENIPWLENGEAANQAYLKARQDAFKHGGLRNKFLQSAAQAWNRNDARAAKALSLRGQSENEQMRKSHREAARVLYESRAHASSESEVVAPPSELYIDLHGLHPEESISYLAHVLQEQKATLSSQSETLSGPEQPEKPVFRPLYVITGTGHHSKGGKDKVGKAIRGWLSERSFVFREFSVPGDRGNVGGILGVDMATGAVVAEDVNFTEHPSAGSDDKAAENLGVGRSDVASDGGAVDDDTAGQVMQIKIPSGPRGLRV